MSTPQKSKPDYSHLSRAELLAVLKLADIGKTQTEIAKVIGCAISTVSETLKQFADTRPLAKLHTESSALRVAKAAIIGTIKASHAGKPEAALELLDRLDVAPKRQIEASTRTQVNIVVGTSGHPVGPDPLSPPVVSTFALPSPAPE